MRKLSFLFLLLVSCQSLQPISEIKGKYKLFNQDSILITFPDDLKGKKVIIGFIYTHCPDICPMIVENMIKIDQKLKKEKNIVFVLVSFDPLRDKPSVMKEFGKISELDFQRWYLLTGGDWEGLINEFKIVTIKRPVNDSVYFIDHTSRISLINSKGKIVKNYIGHVVNIDEVVNDVKRTN
ncbi:MAG: SCO family protein [candidate division WOR-3 bacterium]